MRNKITFQDGILDEYKYSDLHLDLNFKSSPKGFGNLYKASNQSDIQIDLDEFAIVNSIRNLFATRKGQMILNPEYGLNLEKYLFQPINSFNARAMAREIINGVERYEPRVRVEGVNVKMNIDEQLYEVYLLLLIPSLKNKKITLTGIFDNNGF
jgi:phage baseplate assembly protein W